MSRQKILIVDDEPLNVDYLEQELEGSDYETISATNGEDALEKVKVELPDLVLLDIMMPLMDGFEVLSRMKVDESTREIPVIVISANNNLQSVVKGIELGAEDYLPKPFEPTLLHARITSSLEKKKLRDLEQLYLKSLEREFDIAREIQQGFLPTELPNVEGWKVAAWFKAAREVAGDFYDAFLLPDGKLLCVVGDVCGKGVGAALFMTLFRSLIRVTAATNTFVEQKEKLVPNAKDRLQYIISFTNTYINQTHGDANMFATLFIGMIDPKLGSLTYANCGNEAAILRAASGKTNLLSPTGPAVGVIPDAQFGVEEITINKGDLLLAYTDGIPDAVDEKAQSFGNERILQLIKRAGTEPEKLIASMKSGLSEFIGNAESFDDITLLAIQRNS